jgi:tetratricopeptide (TPR) repeat protein
MEKNAPVDIDAALAHWEGLEERPEMGLPLTRAILVLSSDDRTKPARAIAVARKSLAFSRHYNDLSGVAISLTTLAFISYRALGDFIGAQQFLEEALAIDQEIGFDLNARWSRQILSGITNLQGRYAEARVHLEASVVHHRVGGISRGLDTVLVALGDAALELNDGVAAQTYFEESIALASRHQRHQVIAAARAGLGIMAAFQGDVSMATAFYEDILIYLQSVGIDVLGYDDGLDNLGFLALLMGHYEQSLAHFEATLLHFRDTGYRVAPM